MKLAWQRLIRFVGPDGDTHFGEPVVSGPEDLHQQLARGALHATCLDGDIFSPTVAKGSPMRVERLLGPLSIEHVPQVKGIGLNYLEHLKESGRTIPKYPVFFIKGRHSIADWGEGIPIPKIAQDEQCDYEGELCFVIGKTGKDIPRAKALDFIAGFVVGNDVSSRKWQRDPVFAGPVPQFNFSKGFDKYAPLGPMIVSTDVAGDGSSLHLETRVNGELRQSSTTSDLLFDVPQLVEFISQGTTLEKGTVVMTGTPSGAAFARKPPPWLSHGDVVEVSVEHLGTLTNRMVFE